MTGSSSLYVQAIILYLPLAVFWIYFRQLRKHDGHVTVGFLSETRFSFMEYLRAMFSWCFLFFRIYSVRPGLYRLNQADDSAPLLVTCNNYLTVFLLVRRVAYRKVRLMIVDTGGINVWCSAGKGRFSAEAIIEISQQEGLLEGKGLEMVLPKLALSGVRLIDLKKAGIRPIIGPVYAADVPEYLDSGDLKNRKEDHVVFGLRARAFTAFPTAVQFFYYVLGFYVITLGYAGISPVLITIGLALSYPILFPWIPGRQFADRGLVMGIAVSLIILAVSLTAGRDLQRTVFDVLFAPATAVFIALSFTGVSPISNYDNVRKETARFLPVVVVLYILLIPVMIFL
ncbi:MAG: hypothetical protein ISR96_02325 [Nitrospira sp.]|nr:hypothetical protein [bacterium]MBL7048352.1 hypothetical protein [Nitrospira sp.]